MNFFRRKKNELIDTVPSEAKAKRILVIGSDKHTGVKCVQWDAKTFPNVADYDSVIVNPMSLTVKMKRAEEQFRHSNDDKLPEIWNRLIENTRTLRKGLLTLLESGGEIYTILCSEEWTKLGLSNLFENQMNNYSWMPLPFDIIEEKGETQILDDISFKKYMDLVKQWTLCIKLPSYPQALRGLSQKYGENFSVRLEQEAIAQNRYGIHIASRFRLALYRKQIINDRWYSDPVISKEPEQISGPLILLPMPTEVNDRNAINVILEDFFYLQQKTLPPQWIEQIDVPSVQVIKRDIENKYRQIEQLKLETSSLLRQKEELEEYKQLLFETGTALEQICQKTLENMGCIVLPADLTSEDFIIEFEGRQAVVEVKGNTKSISLQDLSQLGRYLEDYLIERDEEKKGILIGNAWRLLPLGERGNNQPLFPENVVSYATKRDIALISSVEIFRAYCLFSEGKASGKDIIDRLLRGVGITSLI